MFKKDIFLAGSFTLLAFSTLLAQISSSKGNYASVNGLRMYYEIHGSNSEKPALVLIHGGGSTITTSFGNVLSLLSKNRTVIAVELQAHGHTSDRNAPESFEQDAGDVVALLQTLNIVHADILGFSNGGNTAIQIALRHSHLVNKLVLASTFYKRDGLIPGFFDGMKHAALDVMPQVLKDAFLRINPDTSKLLAMFTKDKNRMLEFKDWTDDAMRSIKSPTLIINGDRDVIVPEHAVAMSKLISNSHLMILPGEHGSYLGVAESPNPGKKKIELTVAQIEGFLEQPDDTTMLTK